ncbi:hypothetical protein [Geomesophilobacter sediminis]|uniref:Uncharacterized protein n=1 Tax=Geomesophilobacter sediminis TaxID=2798584 RepID=A0A8J7J7F8_9BACT|nr:hypothetical protein [Geomesophilobacter sediminis]MBJ6725141.1 hypothetical protein [Geomesophilobacter sediminis]
MSSLIFIGRSPFWFEPQTIAAGGSYQKKKEVKESERKRSILDLQFFWSVVVSVSEAAVSAVRRGANLQKAICKVNNKIVGLSF